MKCPKCRKKLDWYLDGLLRPGFNSRYCPFCTAKLELQNPGICYFTCGIIFVTLLFSLILGQVPHVWVWALVAGIICWLINPLIIKLMGRWSTFSYNDEEIGKANLINAVNTISTLIAAVWVIHMIFILILPYWQIIDQLAEFDDKAYQTMEEYRQVFKPMGILGLALGIISVGTMGTTSYMRGSLRKKSLQRKLKSEIQSKD